MASQLDLDQGGTFRQTRRVYMGPSVGWVSMPDTTVVPIITTGTTTILRGMNLVTINVNGLVTVQLPSSLRVASPQAIPFQSEVYPIVVMDIGGFANDSTSKYTILPAAGQLISSLASIDIVAPYGAFVLNPLPATGGWTMQQ